MHLGTKSYTSQFSMGVKHHRPFQSLGVRHYFGAGQGSLISAKSHHNIYNHVSNSELVHRIPLTHTEFGGVKRIDPFAGRNQSAHIEKERKNHHQRFT